MRPVSDRFLDALTGSHNMAVRLRAVPAGQTGTNPVDGIELLIISGDVQLESSAGVRATIECEVAAVDPDTGEDLWPAAASDALTPYGGYELFAERGVAFGGGSIEYVSLGYFRIDNVEQPDAPNGPIRITGSDRMSMIIDATLTDPKQYAATDTYVGVVSDLVLDAYADAEIDWDDLGIGGDAIGRSVVVESDRYAFLRELVTSVGKVAYFDHRGRLTIKSPPDPTMPLWTVARGAYGVLVSVSRSLSREGVYNGVIATGEAFDTETPARGLATDDGVSSPTRWGGPFGKVPREFSSPLLTTDAQAKLAAATVLQRSLGLPYNVDFTAIPNPALEPDDPIAVGIEGAPTIVTPTLLAADSFSRTVVNGVGTPDYGPNWNILAGGSANYAVNSGVLKKTLAVGFTAFTRLNLPLSRRNIDVYQDVRVPNAATVSSLVAGFQLRWTDDNDYYSARLEFNASGTVTLKIADHYYGYAETGELADFASYTANQWWTVRVRTVDSKIQIKAWPTANSQPGAWMLTDENADRVSPGNQVGLWWWRVAGNTNNSAPQFEHDNVQVYSVPPQPLLGGELHIMDSIKVPLVATDAMTAVTREQSLTVIGTT